MARMAIVVPTYGRDSVLVDTVRALLVLRPKPSQIIVADQTPQHDPTASRYLADHHEARSINWLRLREPSIPRAMNQGLLATASEIVLFLDDDIVPDEALVEAHLEAHVANPGRLIAGRVLQPWHGDYPDPLGSKGFDLNAPERRDVEEFMGCNFSVPRQHALALGGFDENFVRVAYRFEAEFAHRWRASGRGIHYEPRALIHHLKVSQGGTRTFGEHLRTIRPDHSVGDYYFQLKTKGLRAVPSILNRLAGSIATRHHLRQPWWIPATLLAELCGIAWAVTLLARGPRYVDAA